MLIRLTIILLLSTITATGFAQFKRKKKGTKADSNQPTSLNPLPEKVYAPKTSKKNSKGPTYGSEQEFYERMERLEKERRKNEKLMLKPQYSNPMYFGHKRQPKKRKAGKLKYCKECGIRH